uniref:MalT-like TPR region domain-containing protein n=1 Tax=Lotharella globosa TaxID=91324 RepID=A0A7S3YK07_9EUKA
MAPARGCFLRIVAISVAFACLVTLDLRPPPRVGTLRVPQPKSGFFAWFRTRRASRLRDEALRLTEQDASDEDLDRAYDLLSEAIGIYRHKLGSDHLEVAETLAQMTRLLCYQGQFGDALECIGQTMAIYDSLSKTKEGYIAHMGMILINMMDFLLEERGRVLEAEIILNRFLDLDRSRLMLEAPEDAPRWFDAAANTLRGMGRTLESLELHDCAISIVSKRTGNESWQFGVCIQNKARALADLNKNSEAFQLYEQALAILTNSLGADHIEVGTTLSNMAYLLADQGEMESAIQYMERAIAILRAYGDPMELARYLGDGGMWLELMGRVTEALGKYEEVVKILESDIGYPKGMPGAIGGRIQIARVHRRMGNTEYAKSVHSEACELASELRAGLGNHEDLVLAYAEIAFDLAEQGRHGKPLKMYINR